jgi:galactokinase
MLFRAPGRVNIIGEHTDYNDGLVLPTTTALYTTVAAAARTDRVVRVDSREMQDIQSFDLDHIEFGDEPTWIDYVKGVAAELRANGVKLIGADLVIESEIPLGGGLSSSASFELAVATALLKICGASLRKPVIVKLCRRAENRYAHVRCGIMDQYAIACCERNMAMLLDCRSLAIQQVEIPETVRLLVIDSGVKRRLSKSDYNRRADECVEAVDLLAREIPELISLRDANMKMVKSRKHLLGDTLYRRCRHVVNENQRVREAFAALQRGDIEILGQLISASHASLRDDFEVSCDEVEQLVAIADRCTGVLGSRMVGAGFGGCVLALARAADSNEAVREIRREYEKVSGEEPWTHVVQAAEPATAIGNEEAIR